MGFSAYRCKLPEKYAISTERFMVENTQLGILYFDCESLHGSVHEGFCHLSSECGS